MTADSEIVGRAAHEVAQYDFGADAGAGFDGQTAEEMQIPFLTLLQSLSPQVDGTSGRHFEGARPGRLFNSVTEEVLGDEVEFVPAAREHVYVEWRPRKQGGGFVARHARDSEVVRRALAEAKEFGKYRTPEGNDLVETFYLFGVVVRGDRVDPVCVAFTSTKIKVFKKWNTRVHMCTVPAPGGRKVRPPRWAHLVRVRTVPQKNAEGSFFNLVLEPAAGTVAGSLLRPDDARYLAARALAGMVASGRAKAAEDVDVGEDKAETAF